MLELIFKKWDLGFPNGLL